MKTRAQHRQQEREQRNKKSKPPKKDVLDRKREGDKLQGEPEGKKKVKADSQPAKTSETRKRGRKQKSIRVTITEPPKDKSKSKSIEKNLPHTNMNRRSSLRKVPTKDETLSKGRNSSKQQKKEEVKSRQSKKIEKKEDAKKSGQSQSKQQIQKIQFKGKVPIDPHFPHLKNSNLTVLEWSGKVYSATLNQTSIKNNNNKFYILQIIQDPKNSNLCYFYTRWGRVGVVGQISCTHPIHMNHAISQYDSKYHDKYNRGNYREVELNYQADEPEENEKKEEETDKDKIFAESKLSKPVKKLIELIFDLNMMKNQMFEIGFDTKKMPLGKLSQDNIKKGFTILQNLMDEIKGKNNKQVIISLTDDFYSYIPHNFGFTKMKEHILDNAPIVKKKIQMLQSLSEIKLAATLIDEGKNTENQLDANYQKLNRDIRAIEKDSETFKIIENYLQSTHGKTHHQYSLSLEDLFQLNSEVENVRYTKEIGNKMLLWHGSRLTNYVGILSQGLRIAPPEAPVSGYMFGKGVYFADMSSKSANYCRTSPDNNTGILLLCEVALGDMSEKLYADYYASNLPDGKHSTKGVGRTAPNPQNQLKVDEVIIPMGPGEPSGRAGATLEYNEFIVYDVAQIKIKYLLRTKFDYKKRSSYGYY